MTVTDELRRLREQDPDLALLLDTFGEIDRVYDGALEAMGMKVQTSTPSVANSAEVRVSFRTLEHQDSWRAP